MFHLKLIGPPKFYSTDSDKNHLNYLAYPMRCNIFQLLRLGGKEEGLQLKDGPFFEKMRYLIYIMD